MVVLPQHGGEALKHGASREVAAKALGVDMALDVHTAMFRYPGSWMRVRASVRGQAFPGETPWLIVYRVTLSKS